MLDVRKPIGWFFIIVGAMVFGWAIVHPQPSPLPYNGSTVNFDINLPWGLVMLVFGIFMLVLIKMDKPEI